MTTLNYSLSFEKPNDLDNFQCEPSLFDDSSVAKLDQNMYADDDMFMFANPSNYQDPFSQHRIQNAWESSMWPSTPTVISPLEPELTMSYGSPASELCPSPPPTTPVLGRMQFRDSPTAAPFMFHTEQDSDSEITTKSPTSAATALANSPAFFRFRYASIGSESTAPISSSRSSTRSSKRQRQSISRRGQQKESHPNDSDNEDEEEEEEEEKEEVDVTTKSSCSKRIRQPHTLVEQRYRNSLNAGIHQLQMAIPHLADLQRTNKFKIDRPQPTKATIIASAVQYIKTIELERDELLAAKEWSRSKVTSRR